MNKQTTLFVFLFLISTMLIVGIFLSNPQNETNSRIEKQRLSMLRSPTNDMSQFTASFIQSQFTQNNTEDPQVHTKYKSALQLQNIIQNEKNHIYQLSEDFETQAQRLKSIAQTLTTADLIELKNIVTDSQKDSDSRYVALHLLTLKNLDAHDLLNEIFFAPNDLLDKEYSAHDARSTLKDIEINLRFLAVEQIEKNLIQNHQLNFNLSHLATRNSYLISIAQIVNLSRASSESLLAKMSSQISSPIQVTK